MWFIEWYSPDTKEAVRVFNQPWYYERIAGVKKDVHTSSIKSNASRNITF